jgi:hypothetical protein
MSQLEIGTNNKSLIDDLQKNIPDGISVKPMFQFLESVGSGSESGIVGVLIEFAPELKGIALGIIANWIYNILVKHKSTKITIDRKTIEFTEGNITSIIKEKIKP